RGGSGYARVRRWAVTPGDVVAPEYQADDALSEYLDVLHERRLRPAFLAVADPDPYLRRAMDLTEVADEAVLDLADFTLVGKKRANLRHSNTSARRAGLTVHAFAPEHAGQIAEISQEWLRTKRGGEMGFTLSRHDDILDQVRAHVADLWVIVDEQQRVQAYCTWRHYRGGQARVIDVMRRRADAPNPAMDSLLVTALERYRDAGLVEASLASVPRDHGAFADRIYPSRSLRAFKQKFAPRWEPRWLAVPAARHRPFAMAAVGRAYSPGGLTRALRHNR
ncbi:MAG: phosphatidylglycerol lysyltransferase domain-containing protein, partial [Jatrophihabitans sp.]